MYSHTTDEILRNMKEKYISIAKHKNWIQRRLKQNSCFNFLLSKDSSKFQPRVARVYP